MACTVDTLIGQSKMIIKPYQGDFVSIKGSITTEKMSLSSVEVPYWQVMKTKIELITNETYTFNGIGDNHNFLLIRVYYDQRSPESSQYINMYRTYPGNITGPAYGCTGPSNVIGQLYLETSNSTNRQGTVILSNPSNLYSCEVELMVSVIDNQKSFFNNCPSPTETTVNHYFNDLKSLNPTQVGIYSSGTLSAFFILSDIANYYIPQRNNTNLVIDDISRGVITVVFVDNYNASQALSALAWLMNSPSNRTLPQPADNTPPAITYTGIVTYISGQGYFSTLYLSTSGALAGIITITDLINLLIVSIADNRDGIIEVESNMLSITDSAVILTNITNTGMFILKISVNDVAGNNTSNNINLTINP